MLASTQTNVESTQMSAGRQTHKHNVVLTYDKARFSITKHRQLVHRAALETFGVDGDTLEMITTNNSTYVR